MEDLGVMEDFDWYCRLFTSLELWAPYARDVCRRHSLVPNERVRVGKAGTYPVFLVEERWVVKFFGRLFEGGQAFQVERDAARLVQGQAEIGTARVIAEGELGGRGWPWPYLIFELIQGVCIGEVFERLPIKERLRVAREMGTAARALHRVGLEGQEVFPNGWGPYLEMLEGRRQACVQNHRGWGTLPAHLVNQIDAYLPPVESLLEPGRAPHLIHADLTRDHLLGQIEGDRWTTLAVIDFGDAMTGSLAYELAALHLDLFGGDRGMLAAFLQSYGGVAWKGEISFARAALSTALLHQFNVLSALPPEMLQASSLEELADSLWNAAG